MKVVVGIDLGTSNTVVAHADPEPRALPDKEGHALIPSVVAFPPTGEVMVGRRARERRIIDPRNTVFSAKRLMGKVWGAPELAEVQRRLPFELRPGDNRSVRVLARGELYSVPEISAFILRKARMVAEEALGSRVDAAVITVPANFDELQRNATKLAGELADLEVLRIINEPTAAALAYGLEGGGARRVVVYDFGGGTFDVTLLEIDGDRFEVRATAGDMNLGGDDVDLLVADRMCEAFLRRYRFDARADPEAFARVRMAAEGLKMDLTGSEAATARLDDLMFGEGGRDLVLDFTLRSRELDVMTGPLVARSLRVCGEALAAAGWSTGDVDTVLLVGGSTRLREVRRQVSGYFGREPNTQLNPDEAVARGAALQARAIAERLAARPPSAPPAPKPPSQPPPAADRPRSEAPPLLVRQESPRWALWIGAAAALLLLAGGVALLALGR